MVRLVLFLIGIAVVASGLSWLADRPGSLLINWQGYEIETSVFRAVVILAFLMGLAILAWSILTALWRSPASVGAFFNRRRQMRGLEALSGGMIAIGAGDRSEAMRYAVQARKALPNEPLTQLLRAQAAQLTGDRATARRMFEAMLSQPDTEQLGLRGLYLEAEREGEWEPARQFAERSVGLNPKLGWAVDALFELQCKDRDWAGALKTLGIAKKHAHADKGKLDRRRAVLMTARAMDLEETDPNRAMGLAIEAHHLAHDLIPAAALAGRMLAARGHTKRAAKIIERAWRKAPHPDLAVVYAHVRLGDSPKDRLDRVKRLPQLNAHSIETPIAIATAAIEAKDFQTARQLLERLDASRMTQRVCTLMARLESEEHGDKGRAREWLARAVHAPRDPAWVADNVVADKWSPVSPVTGAFDAFQWRVPADAIDAADREVLAAKLDELVKLGAPVSREADVRSVPDKAPRDEIKPAAAPATAAKFGGGKRPDVEDAIVTEPVRPVKTEPQHGTPASDRNTQPRPPEPVTPLAKAAGQNAEAKPPEKKPLDPNMFIAPKDEAAKDDPGKNAGEADVRAKPRIVASGPR